VSKKAKKRVSNKLAGALTPKQRRFKDEYLVDTNATKAAIRAGYSKKTAQQQGARLLLNVVIRAAIDAAQNAISEKTGLTAEWVVERLRIVAERCLQSEPVLDKEGNQIYVETPNGDVVPAYTFQAMGASKALELIGKHLGIFEQDNKQKSIVRFASLPRETLHEIQEHLEAIRPQIVHH